MYTLYSQRLKDAQGDPEVFIYDHFESTFRNQFYTVISKVINKAKQQYTPHGQDEVDTKLCQIFAQEKGLKNIPGSFTFYANTLEALEAYIDSCTDEDFLDLMDFIFGAFLSNPDSRNTYQYTVSEYDFTNAIDELNLRLKQHGLGYEFVNREIIKKTNTVLHENAVKPALKLLTDEEFRGAEQEYVLAFEHFKKLENKDAVLNAGKAFESTMKIICSGMGYAFDSTRDTAKNLVDTLKKNSFFPKYLESYMNGICTTLESGAPTVRNKIAGHGQGTEIKQVSDEYVEYVLNLVASNILFLYRLYRQQKSN